MNSTTDTARNPLDRILVLEMVRVTEAAAVAASKLIGRGDEKAADAAAVEAMRQAFDELYMDGTVVIGEGERDEAPMLYIGEKVGGAPGKGPKIDIALDPPADLSETTVWEVVTFHWDNREGGQAVDGHVLVPGRDAALGVISDIDDTVIETGISGNLRAIARNWRRVLMQMPDERLLVPQADVFYTALGGGAVLMEGDGSAGERLPATHHPFFYVSSSPWNLFSYLVAFMKSRKLPLGPLMLRDWGLNRETFGSGSHGAHKTEAIHRIIETYPDMRFALIGDDTQGDLVAFAKVVADHPGRIRAVFIRRAGDPFTPEEREAKATIESANVPLWLGDDYETGHQFLGSIGLSQDGEAEEIVRMVDRTGKGDTVAAEEGAI